MIRIALIFSLVLIGLPWVLGHIVPPQWVGLAVLVAVGLVARLPAVNRPIGDLIVRSRSLSPAALNWTTLAVGVMATAYLLASAFYQHRQLIPRIHDEHCYIIQSRMLAAGKLWEPQHPVADFFDTFYILSRPVYAPIYFPGTALFEAPVLKMGAPTWCMPLLLTGASVAITFYLVALLVDWLAGFTAAFIAIGSLREFSMIVMAQAPITFLGLLIFCAWIAWRKDRRPWRAAIIAALIGWAAITRPVDALAFALPVVIAMALDWRKLTVGRGLCTIIAMILAMAPFAALQGILNRGTTGNVLETPYTLYLKQYMPGSEFGFHSPPRDVHQISMLPQKQQYMEKFRDEEIREHTLSRLPTEFLYRSWLTFYCTLPAGILAVLLPAALFGLNNDLRRSVFLIPLPLFILLYLPNPFFLAHYPIPVAPIVAFSIALAIHVLSGGRRDRKPNPTTAAFLTLIALGVCVSSFPEIRKDVRDGTVPAMPLMELTHRELASAVNGPSVVLFRFSPADNSVEEPVYNDDVTWPDDAPVIRAHDLGRRNIEIARYYAARQPWRKFYLLDRQENLNREHLLLHPLGDAKHFAESFPVEKAAKGSTDPRR